MADEKEELPPIPRAMGIASWGRGSGRAFIRDADEEVEDEKKEDEDNG